MTGKKGNRIEIFMGKEGQGKIFSGALVGVSVHGGDRVGSNLL